jgi:sulfonate transport system substrate-binding protein
MQRRTFAAAFSALTLLALTPLSPALAEDKPTVIRIGFPGAGTGGRPIQGGSYPTNAHLFKEIDDEFKGDGIKIEWKFFPGAGPALNESYANGLIDVAFGHGDLPLIVGRATGLKHKIVMAASRFGSSYFVVPAGSTATSIADLKGKRLSTFKGTAGQLTLYRWLDKFGFSDKDFRIISLDNDSTKAALATSDIDGTVITPFDLEARGIVKRVVELRDDPKITRPGTVWVGEEFEKKYPQIVQRIVTRLVKVAHWSTQEANREKEFQAWATSGAQAYVDYKKDWETVTDLRKRLNPLLGEYYVASLKNSIEETKKYKLIRKDVSIDGWIEPKYLNQALQDLQLEDYWPQFDAEGKLKVPARKLAAKN